MGNVQKQLWLKTRDLVVAPELRNQARPGQTVGQRPGDPGQPSFPSVSGVSSGSWSSHFGRASSEWSSDCSHPASHPHSGRSSSHPASPSLYVCCIITCFEGADVSESRFVQCSWFICALCVSAPPVDVVPRRDAPVSPVPKPGTTPSPCKQSSSSEWVVVKPSVFL